MIFDNKASKDFKFIEAGSFLLLDLKLPKERKKANRAVELALQTKLQQKQLFFSYKGILFPDGKEYIYIWHLNHDEKECLDFKKYKGFVNKWYHLAQHVFEKEINQKGYYHKFILEKDCCLSVSYINRSIVDLKILPLTEDRDSYLEHHIEKFYEVYRIELEHKGVSNNVEFEPLLLADSLVIESKINFLNNIKKYLFLSLVLILLPCFIGIILSFQTNQSKEVQFEDRTIFTSAEVSPLFSDLITFIKSDWSYEGNGLSGILVITFDEVDDLDKLKQQLKQAEYIKHVVVENLDLISDKQYKVTLEISR